MTASILIFLDWGREFHVHVDASSIDLGAIFSQLGEGDIDQPISFVRQNISTTENNCTVMKCRGFDMVYALHKFRHYLLGSHFKMYTDHFALRYLVNKTMLGEIICIWLLLFKEYDFEVVVKLRKLNGGAYHLSSIISREDVGNIDDNFSDA